MNHTPGPWNWHDAFGRKNGQGQPLGIGTGITGDVPPVGSASRFSFAVSDRQGFVVAHCTNALITMSEKRSEANARLISKAPILFEMLKALSDADHNTWRAIKQRADAVIAEIEKEISET